MKKFRRELGLHESLNKANQDLLSLKDREIYSGIEVPEGPFFIRLDGWKFHTLTRKLRMRRPFDKRFAKCMVEVVKAFFVPFNPAFAYFFSDEISVFFPKAAVFQRVEKIDSVSAGIASSGFSDEIRKKFGEKRGATVAFDCRVIPVRNAKEIQKYLVWRQVECSRNHNNAWAQWLLEKKGGLRPAKVAKELRGVGTADLRRIAKKYGVNLDKTPGWQRNGILVVWEHYQKTGFDPLKKKRVVVERRKPCVNWCAPWFNSIEGRAFIKDSGHFKN